MTTAALHCLELPRAAPARVLATGAWLKNSACLVQGRQVWVSPVHGDLGDPAHRAALLASVAQLQALADGPIQAVAHDLHPDFFSTELAQQLAHRLGVPAVPVQHHHAHLAVVQAEQGLCQPVLGWALDGVGLGPDGTVWGGECLAVDAAQYERVAHLPSLVLPGGDVAAREPWRMAAALLRRLGWDGGVVAPLMALSQLPGQPRALTPGQVNGLNTVLQKGLNCPVSTSAGRWFDAIAGTLGLCLWQTEEAQAAQALERCAAIGLAQAQVAQDPTAATPPSTPQPMQTRAPTPAQALDAAAWRVVQLGQLACAQPAQSPQLQAQGAALFHVALVQFLAVEAQRVARERGLRTVLLAGGCFFNAILRERLCQALEAAGLTVLTPRAHNYGDAGLALGQAWVGAQQISAAALATSTTRTLVCA